MKGGIRNWPSVNTLDILQTDIKKIARTGRSISPNSFFCTWRYCYRAPWRKSPIKAFSLPVYGLNPVHTARHFQNGRLQLWNNAGSGLQCMIEVSVAMYFALKNTAFVEEKKMRKRRRKEKKKKKEDFLFESSRRPADFKDHMKEKHFFFLKWQ